MHRHVRSLAWGTALALVLLVFGTFGIEAQVGGLVWEIEAVEAGGVFGLHTSVALDGQGRPHVVYVDGSVDAVKYAVRDGGEWEIHVVDVGGGFAGGTNLVLDGQGRPHVSYLSGMRGAVLYAVGDGLQWERHRVDAALARGSHGLAVDAQGVAHLAYSYLNTKLQYARWDGQAWQSETVDPKTIDARYISLALDPGGRPHIAYQGFTILRYALWDGDQWNLEVVDDAENVGGFASLAIDLQGVSHVAYRDAHEGDLRYARRTGSSWNLELVDRKGDAGWDIDLALGPGATVHVAYYERLNSELRHARQSGEEWLIDVVDTEGVVGWYAAAAVDFAGRPHLTYYDWSQGRVEYAIGFLHLAIHTLPASDVTPTGAVLQGDLLSLGVFPRATVFFEWRPKGDSVWRSTEPETLARAGPYEAPLTNLTPGQEYEFRALADAGGTTTLGRLASFRTLLPPDTEGAARLILATQISLGVLAGLALVWAVLGARLRFREGHRQR